MGRRKGGFYGVQPSEAGAQPPDLDLAGAAGLAGLDDEIALLRALIKRAVQLGQHEEARRQVQALCQAVRLQRTLPGEPADDARRILDDVLAEIRQEQALEAGR
jgi:hypothetical protein